MTTRSGPISMGWNRTRHTTTASSAAASSAAASPVAVCPGTPAPVKPLSQAHSPRVPDPAPEWDRPAPPRPPARSAMSNSPSSAARITRTPTTAPGRACSRTMPRRRQTSGYNSSCTWVTSSTNAAGTPGPTAAPCPVGYRLSPTASPPRTIATPCRWRITATYTGPTWPTPTCKRPGRAGPLSAPGMTTSSPITTSRATTPTARCPSCKPGARRRPTRPGSSTSRRFWMSLSTSRRMIFGRSPATHPAMKPRGTACAFTASCAGAATSTWCSPTRAATAVRPACRTPWPGNWACP